MKKQIKRPRRNPSRPSILALNTLEVAPSLEISRHAGIILRGQREAWGKLAGTPITSVIAQLASDAPVPMGEVFEAIKQIVDHPLYTADVELANHKSVGLTICLRSAMELIVEATNGGARTRSRS